ncbi:MAG: DegV family protein [Butyricicoccaceae bacterium]
MSDYVIVSDSVLDIDKSFFVENDVRYVPLSITMDGIGTMEDDFYTSISAHEFFDHMRNGRIATTSQGTVGYFMRVYKEILESGKDIVYIGFSSGLSGSFNSGCMARDELAEQYPDRKIYCVDTKAAAGAYTMLVRRAVERKNLGDSAEELAAWVEKTAPHMIHWVTVDSLFHLMRGGRVSKTSAVVGSLVGIKPVIVVMDDGKLKPVHKVRGRKQSLAYLAKMTKKHIQKSEFDYVSISHGDCPEDAEYLKSLLVQEVGIPEDKIYIHVLDMVIGAHTGPGVMTVFFYGDARTTD